MVHSWIITFFKTFGGKKKPLPSWHSTTCSLTSVLLQSWQGNQSYLVLVHSHFDRVVGVTSASCTCFTQEGPHLCSESAWSPGTTRCWCQTGGISSLRMLPYAVGTTVYISQRCTSTSLRHVSFFCTSVKTRLCCVYILLQSYMEKRLELLCWWKGFCRQLYNQLNSVLCRICGLPKSNCRVEKSTGFIHSEETKGTFCLLCTLKP